MTQFTEHLRAILAERQTPHIAANERKQFFKAARYHQLYPAIQEITPFPELKKLHLHNIKRVHRQQLTSLYLANICAELAIRFVWLKGIPLTQKLYQTPSSRFASDIDVLVDSSDAAIKLAEHLIANDWKLLSSDKSLAAILEYSKDIVVHHPNHGVLEIHTQVGRFQDAASQAYEAWLWQHTPEQSAFAPEELLYLCYHGSATGFHRLKWAYDIHLYIETWLTQIDSEELAEALLSYSRKHDVENVLLLSWNLCHHVFNTPLPRSIHAAIENKRKVRFATKRVIKNANQCSGFKAHLFYRLERRLFWYFSHESKQQRGLIRKELYRLATKRITHRFTQAV